MSEFKISYNASMGHEGQYSNDPRDLGGETWKGIARKMHPDWKGWEIIDQVKANVLARDLNRVLNQDEELEEYVQEFYQEEYWKALLLDQIKDQDITNEIFDTAINQGSIKSAKFFQDGLNLLNNNQKHYSDIEADGHIGPATIKAYNAYMFTANFPGRSYDRNVKTLLKVLNGLQFGRYREICQANPGQEAFFYGWINRV